MQLECHMVVVVYAPIHLYTHTCAHIYTHTHTHTYTHAHTSIHTYTHARAHTHTHTLMNSYGAHNMTIWNHGIPTVIMVFLQ